MQSVTDDETRDVTPRIEFFVRERKYRAPVSTIGAVVFTALFSLSYTSWIEYRGLDGKCGFMPRLTIDVLVSIMADPRTIST